MTEQDPDQVAKEKPLTDADEAPDGDDPASGAGYGNHAEPDTDASQD